MATLLLSGVGSALGQGVGGGFGSAVGYTLGALGGQLIDRRLFGSSDRDSDFSPPKDIFVQTSSEGVGMARVFGTVRVSGQVIWATAFKRHQGSSGLGKLGQGSSGGVIIIRYRWRWRWVRGR